MLGATAHAAPPPSQMTSRHAPGSDELPADAAALVRAADADRLAGRFADAEASYRAALALVPDAEDITLDLALCLSAQGKAREAAPLLARLLRTTRSASTRERASLALVDARRALGTVTVETPRAGISIEVDGVPRGPAPLADLLYLDPGPHTIRASLEGRLPAVAELSVEPGRTYRVQLDPPPTPPAIVVPEAHEGPRRLDPPGVRDLFLGVPGGLRAAALAVSAASLAGAISALAIADSNRAALDAYGWAGIGSSTCAGAAADDFLCARRERAIQDRDTANTASIVLLSGAGVAAVAAALSILLIPRAPRPIEGSLSVGLSAIASPAGGGLCLEASW